MATVLELLGDAPAAGNDQPAVPDSPGDFQGGLRRGLRSSGGMLASAVGGAADAAGYTNVGQRAHDYAAEQQRAVAEDLQNDPNAVQSFRDVHGLRDAYNYLSGGLGQSVPQGAAMLAGGLAARTPVGRVLGAAAADMPFETGDVVQRQHEDATSMQAPADERFGQALLAGRGAALVNAAVPGGTAERIASGAASSVGRRGLRQMVTDVGKDALVQGGAGVAGEAAKEGGVMLSDPDRHFDPNALVEAGAGGVALGAGMHALGAVGELAHAPGDAVGSVGKAISDRVASARDSASQALSGAKDAAKDVDLSSPIDKISSMYDKGTQAAKDFVDRVANQEDVADVSRVAGQAADKIKGMLPELDDERVQRVKQMATDLMDKAGLDEGRRAQLAQAMTDLTDRGNQAVVAGLEKGRQATQDFVQRAQDLYDTFKGTAGETPDGVKKSADFSGITEAIKSEIVPALQRSNPDVFDDPKALRTVADGVRMAMDSFAKGGKDAIDSTRVAKLIDIFGDDTVNVLDSVYRAMGKVDPKEAENFYGALNEIRAQQKDTDKTLGLMMRSLNPELQDTVKVPQLRQELGALRDWFSTAYDPGSEKAKFDVERLRFTLESRYGKNADKILEAVEKEAKANRTPLAASEEEIHQQQGLSAEEASALQGKTIYYGRGAKGEELALHPDLDPAGDKGQAHQALARATKENPDKSVSFISSKELGEDHPAVQGKMKQLLNDFAAAGKEPKEAARLAKEAVQQYGIVAAEGSRDVPGRVDRTNLRDVMVKSAEGEKTKSSHYKNDAVFKAGNVSYDAIALTEMMRRQFKDEFNTSDDKSTLHRTGRMFQTGIAALSDHLGHKIEVPDNLVIDKAGTTFGEVKGLDYSPHEGKGEGEKLTAYISRLRTELKGLKEDVKADAANGVDTSSAKKHIQGLIKEAEFAKEKFEKTRDAELVRTGREKYDGEKEGRRDPDPFNNSVHELAKTGGVQPLNTDTSGASLEKTGAPDASRLKPEEVKALTDKFASLQTKAQTAAQRAVAAKGLELMANVGVMNKSAHRTLFGMLTKGKNVSDIAAQVNALHEKYKGQFEQKQAFKGAQEPARAKEKEMAPALPNPDTASLDKDFAATKFPEFKNAKEADDYLVRAYRRWGELEAEMNRVLNDESHPTNDLPPAERKAMFGMAELFASDSRADLSSFYPDFGVGGAEGKSDAQIRAMLKKAAPEVAAQLPKAAASRVGVGNGTLSEKARKQVEGYIDDVLGPTVKTEFTNLPHAGEFERAKPKDVVRISVHALNPMSVAYHESLHGFFAKLMDQGNTKVGEVLRKAAMAGPIQAQLRRLLASEPAALAQLRDPEEAAAYMYQFWAAGKLQLGHQSANIFERMASAVRKVFGVWSESERAGAIMDYFHSGEFKANMGAPNAVAKALLESGRNQVLEHAKRITKPLVEVADAISTAGGQRLRDTGVPALRELADIMKATGRDEREDAGFVPAARLETTRLMNDLGARLRGYTAAHMQDALEAMQAGRTAATPEGRLVQDIVQGKNGLLPSMLEYMRTAGVDVAKIQPRADYFPRKYDASYISRHQDEFVRVLESNGIASNDARGIMHNLVATDGAEFTIETDRPGMQHLKTRVLGDIPDAQLAPFMKKDLVEILSSYVSQAARRAEWARRLGDDGLGLTRLLDTAKKQGASDEQIDVARKLVRAVDGTLGDSLSPTARRLMGNVIVYQNLRLLPLAIFSSVVDPMGIMVRGGTVSDAWSAFKRGIKEIPASWKNAYPDDHETRLATQLGVIDDAMLAHTTGQLYMQGMVGDTAKKINDTLFRFNLMEGFNRSMRVGATQAAIKFLERHQDGTADPHSARWLGELGLKPGFKMDLADPKVRAAINQWVDGAVLRPDSVDKPIWMNDPHWMLVSHLKQFVYAFQETILKRVYHEMREGNYRPAMALSAYVPIMIASDALKGAIQNGGSQPDWKKDWGPQDYLGSGIERAGLLGKLQFPADGLQMMMGPTAQQALSVAESIDGKQPGKAALKALPGEALYASWVDGKGSSAGNGRVENSMSVD